MQAWLQSGRKMRWLASAGILAAMVAAVGLGQAVPQEMPEFGEASPSAASVPSRDEPPMVDVPNPAFPPASPSPPFMPPSPTPLPPEQAAPYIPGMPLPYTQPFGRAMVGGAIPAEPPVPVVRLPPPSSSSDRAGQGDRVSPHRRKPLRRRRASRPGRAIVCRARGRLCSRRTEMQNEDSQRRPDGSSLGSGNLAGGAQKTIVLVIKAKGNEEIQNCAYVQFEHGIKVATQVAKPGAQVRVTAPAQTLLYQPVAFRIEVVNTGDVALRNVVVTDELPAGLEFVQGKPEPNSDKPLTWKLGDVLPRQTRLIEYQAISKRAGTFRDKVRVTADAASQRQCPRSLSARPS